MTRYMVLAGLIAGLVLSAACGPGPAGIRAFEEQFLDEGVAPRMIEHGDKLYMEGRLPESHAAYLQAENQAFTYKLRKKARDRRMYVEQVIQAYQRGEKPPVPPQPKKAEPKPEEQAAADPVPPPPWVQNGQPAQSSSSVPGSSN